MFAIPLAWLQLLRERTRLLVALAGIGFAVILMFMQLGFRDALFESAITLHKSLQGDIFLISPQSNALIAMRSFSERRLFQARGYDGVDYVSPIYLDFRLWKNPQTRRTRGIMVIGTNPDDPVFDLPAYDRDPLTGAIQPVKFQSLLQKVKIPDQVLFDKDSRPEFIPIIDPKSNTKVLDWFRDGTMLTTEVGGRRVTVAGLFKMGASFGADGNIITSYLNFIRIFNSRKRGIIDVGLVKLKPGADGQQVLAAMRGEAPPPPKNWLGQSPQPETRLLTCKDFEHVSAAGALPKDVCVLSKAEFAEFERSYWQNSTAIGFIFGLGTAMGFVVGSVIVYQILYTDVTDHLPEYATLKAMGYRNLYLTGVVFQEALILAVLGYIPGFVLCLGLYNLTQNATSLPIVMTAERAVLVFILTLLMCIISSIIAIRKVQSADPAEIF
ncbi:MAG: FtsX-like permease family protein [Cyanobacteria bacterium]|nr:FtsX-like permease family protein [Cyanobacteriota bacterium]MDW8202326.1 FtsX-like permease family protein [Cyanobacteriota bacterium SKYGB_h_bin112]